VPGEIIILHIILVNIQLLYHVYIIFLLSVLLAL